MEGFSFYGCLPVEETFDSVQVKNKNSHRGGNRGIIKPGVALLYGCVLSSVELTDLPEDLEKQYHLPSEKDSDSVDEVSTNADAELQRFVLQEARLFVSKWPKAPTDAADDLGQRALLKYYKLTEAQREQIIDLEAYMYGIIRNEFYTYLKEQGTDSVIQLDEAEESSTKFPTTDERKSIEASILLQEIWVQLNDEEQGLFDLLIQGYTSKELAIRLGISPSTARKRVERFRNVLKNLLIEKRAQSG